jgi:hypothetical protein
VADGKDGNHRCLAPLRGLDCGLLVRLRRDRVLYRRPEGYSGRGRPRVHGERFAFQKPDTWHAPDQCLKLDDAKWGRVEIRFWSDLHAREDADTIFAVLCIQTHLERDHPPQPLWLGWIGTNMAADDLWRCYQHRWPIEMVFTQMTKRDLFAFRTGRDGISDFDLVVIDYDPINKKFDQLAALGKGQGLQGRLNALTEVLNTGSNDGQVNVLLGLSVQLSQLMAQTIVGFGGLSPFALEFIDGDDLGQISFQQASLLTFHLGNGLLQGAAT